MPESLIGKWFYVCNCGPECKCGHRAEVPSECPCGHAAALRRVLAEDEHAFYVAETGHESVRNELSHDKPFVTADGRALQGFAKAWKRKGARKIQYRGIEIQLTEDGQSCTVVVGGKTFSAMRHDNAGWMGFPCYRMFESPEQFAKSLVDDWDIIGNDAILAPPRDHGEGVPGGPGPTGRGPSGAPRGDGSSGHGHRDQPPGGPQGPVRGGRSVRGGRADGDSDSNNDG